MGCQPVIVLSPYSEDRNCEFSDLCYLDFLLHFFCSVMGFPVIRLRGKFRPEIPEPLPTPAASVIDVNSDEGNLGGEHVSGGFTLLSIHNTTMLGGGVVFALFVVALVVIWLCWRGHLQRCCHGCCVGCLNQDVQRESQDAPVASAPAPAAPFVPVTERFIPMPVQVPSTPWEQVASAPRPIEMAETIRGIAEILDEQKRRSRQNKYNY